MHQQKNNNLINLYIKGIAMGIADIIPGISGGTIALITGIYKELIESISSFDHHFLKKISQKEFRLACESINIKFLATVFIGIISAILLTSKVIHYLLENHSTFTWSFFFGLVSCSIIVLLNKIPQLMKASSLLLLISGVLIGHLAVTLVPIQTPETNFYTFIAGFIAISAMILPGISGSFLLLIMGKYAFITGALKDITNLENIKIIIFFILGCILGILSFAKIIKKALNKSESLVLTLMTGFIIGSLQKLWPWREVTESIVIRGKVRVLSERLYIPEITTEFTISLALFALGFIIVFLIEKQSTRGLSSAG